MNKCQICGDEIIILHDKWTGYQEPKTYEIVQCKKCNVSYAMPTKVDNKIYDKIYENQNMIPGYDRYYKFMKKIKKSKKPLRYLYKSEDVYCSVIKCIEMYSKNHKKNKAEILEIGSGLGYLTYALNMSKYKVLGVDISQNAVDKAIKQFGNFYERYDVLSCEPKHMNKYDVIIMNEVIEHIEEPKEFLKIVYLMLKANGILIITTPNKNAYNKDKNAIWKTDLPPIHLWWFSEESINIMAKESNFIKVDFFDVSQCSNAFYDYYHPELNKTQEPPEHVLKKNGKVIVLDKKDLLLVKRIISKGIDILRMRDFYMKKIKLARRNSKPCAMCVILRK